MKNRYRLFRRGRRFYVHDSETNKQSSLNTSDPHEARRLLNVRNDACRLPQMNLVLAKTFLTAHDPSLAVRTWKEVMVEVSRHGKESTQARYQRAIADSALDLLRERTLIQTTADDLLAVLRMGSRCTNHFLRRLHNRALGLGWLLTPILYPKQWPKLRWKMRRGITREEHQLIVSTECNEERRRYYELLWEIGGSQSDVVNLRADNIDWDQRVLTYHRMKLPEDAPPAQIAIGSRLEELLRRLPAVGPLFPNWSKTLDKDRSAEFRRRCRILKIDGVSLHSYRYAWAERAFASGYPERFAMANLGHSSRAVHRSYAKAARVVCPPLEEFESRKVLTVSPAVT